ncbi:MAG: hypothetical protein JWO31_959 [Phycisphaerales bacterium]|nr:hypothetical protein [Phycisphaerales bacterium]
MPPLIAAPTPPNPPPAPWPPPDRQHPFARLAGPDAVVLWRDAVEFAWVALLDEVGEPFVPDWRAYGYYASPVYGRRWAGFADQWWVLFSDWEAWGGMAVAYAWVDKRTGDTRVWVNEAYDPAYEPLADAVAEREA